MNGSDHPLLDIRGVHRIHDDGANRVTALAGVTLTVAPCELIALMGPSGSGKSTLLHVAGGLDRPTSGSVSVLGVDLAGLDATKLAALRRRAVGYVFQDLNLVSTLTLAENAALPLELDGVPRRRAHAAGQVALGRVGVADLADRFPEDVSGGQRQRAAIARAMVGERRLLLADEPTGALDSATAEDVMSVIRGLVDSGSGAIVATHDPRLAAWADRVIFMRDGTIVDETTSSASDAGQWPWGESEHRADDDTGEVARISGRDPR